MYGNIIKGEWEIYQSYRKAILKFKWNKNRDFLQSQKTKQNKTKQNITKQNKTKQNKTKQNKTKQNKTKYKNKNKNKNKKTKQKQKHVKNQPISTHFVPILVTQPPQIL